MDAPGRAGATVVGIAALGASFLLGVAVAGGTGTTAAPPDGPTPRADRPPLQLVNADLELPGSCDALLDSYVERGVERVGPYGWDFPVWPQMAGAELGMAERDAVAGAGEPEVTEARGSETGTNVQEAGVDEPDVVKTDGELLVRIVDGGLEVHDVTGAEPVKLSDTDLPDLPAAELLLVDDRAVVVSARVDRVGEETTRLAVVDLADPAAPRIVGQRSWDTELVRAVQHGDTVRLVLRAGLPDLDFVQPRLWRGDKGALSTNHDVVRKSTIEDWLPTETTYGADGAVAHRSPLLECDQVAVPADEDAALGTMAVVGLDLSATDPLAEPERFGLATTTELAYFSPTRMYLATSAASTWGCCWDIGRPMVPGPRADLGRSRIYAFGLDDTRTTYTASGSVDGLIADRWAMDEHDGVLRVAVGPSSETGNFSSVLTLREDGDELEEIGRVDRLGVDERITSVRWFDRLAIVVTFRQVDPLYAIDLADPADPRLLGELKIPGFSDYLHPIDGQRLIGMGQDASPRTGMVRGAQAALFDVSDLTQPRRTDLVRYRAGSVAAAGDDPRQFSWLPERDVALAVVWQGWEGRTGWVSVLDVTGDRLANRMVEVEHGSDVGLLRLVPLPDGRVVLVTGEDVTFFDVIDGR